MRTKGTESTSSPGPSGQKGTGHMSASVTAPAGWSDSTSEEGPEQGCNSSLSFMHTPGHAHHMARLLIPYEGGPTQTLITRSTVDHTWRFEGKIRADGQEGGLLACPDFETYCYNDSLVVL